MAEITDATAIRFSNQRIRVGADRLARSYYDCQRVKQRWDSIAGDSQAKIDLMEGDIRSCANRLMEAYGFSYDTEKIWFVLGSTSMIPNTADPIVDSSPSDGRPAVTGTDAVRIIDRVVQFQNWLLSSTGSFTDSARDSTSYINTVYAATSEANVTMSVADAGNFISRCGELMANYEATSGQNLEFILSYAVNPNP